jgi:hypothetical protein
MSAKIEIIRGRTFILPGEWAEDFLSSTTLSCVLVREGQPQITLDVELLGVRNFQIYGSHTDTATYVPGIYSAVLNRTDVAFFPNGEDYVRGPETFVVEVI